VAFTPKKRKNLETAQKYAQKGQYDKALKEYQRLLKTDPKDANLRLKIGDLHLKLGEAPRAIEAYSQVAEEFSKGGFDAKAVAIYKQILRVNEDHLEARVALGDHFQRMGLKSDALREFQAAVDLCQRRELKREAFDLLKRVASLDPGNVPNRLHLAELLQREALDGEAREEYGALLAEVAHQGEPEVQARVAEQTLKSFPDHREALLALVTAKVSLGQPKEALQQLERAARHHAEDIEVLEARISVLEALEDSDGAQRAWGALAEAYKRRGDVEKARDVLQRHCSPTPLAASEDTTSQSILLTDAADEDEVADPEPGFDVSGAVDVSGVVDVRGAAASTMSVEELFAEARVSYEFGDPAEARKLSRMVLQREPGHAAARDLLKRIDGAPAPRVDATPEFELDAPELERELGSIPPDGGQSLPDIEIVLEDEADRDDAYASVDPPSELGLAPVEEPEQDQIEFEVEVDEDLEPPPAAPAPVAHKPAASAASPAPRRKPPDAARIAENLEEAEFYLSQGMEVEAEELFRRVLEAQPQHPQALLRLGEIESRREAPPAPAPRAEARPRSERGRPKPAPKALPEIPELDISGASAPRPPSVEAPQLELEPVVEAATSDSFWELPPDDSDRRSESGELVAQAENTQELPEPLPELDPEPAPAAQPTFDPSELLDTSSGLIDADLLDTQPTQTPSAVQIPEEEMFDLAAELEEFERSGEISQGDRPRFGFDEVFRDFKKGIQQQIGEEDADAHYDLAIAYKEMGLLEDALRELAIVQRQGSRPAETLSLMATCKLELGRPQEAVTDLKGALQIATATDLQLSLRYELAEALIAAGKPAEALTQFKRVAAADAAYRDVQGRIAELQ
jgi:tetratricopeptide (TPR) repeat protein